MNDSISGSVRRIIANMGWHRVNLDGNACVDQNFEDTPERVDHWLQSNFTNKSEAISSARSHTKQSFDTENNQMLVQGPIRVYSLCPHHLVTVEYDIWIGIVLQDSALGLSKYTRICESLCKYPWLQEDLTNQIACILTDELKSKGIMVVVEGTHYCMKMRGVKQQNAVTVTSEIKGIFLDPPMGKNPKGEFLDIVSMRKLAGSSR